jgi:hypothetical protein
MICYKDGIAWIGDIVTNKEDLVQVGF